MKTFANRQKLSDQQQLRHYNYFEYETESIRSRYRRSCMSGEARRGWIPLRRQSIALWQDETTDNFTHFESSKNLIQLYPWVSWKLISIRWLAITLRSNSEWWLTTTRGCVWSLVLACGWGLNINDETSKPQILYANYRIIWLSTQISRFAMTWKLNSSAPFTVVS